MVRDAWLLLACATRKGCPDILRRLQAVLGSTLAQCRRGARLVPRPPGPYSPRRRRCTWVPVALAVAVVDWLRGMIRSFGVWCVLRGSWWPAQHAMVAWCPALVAGQCGFHADTVVNVERDGYFARRALQPSPPSAPKYVSAGAPPPCLHSVCLLIRPPGPILG